MKINFKRLAYLSFFITASLYSTLSMNDADVDSRAYTLGKQFYTEGLQPNGKLVKATIQGDIAVEGDQLICETCHRKSGMGSTEGQQVVPAVAGNVLFKPLKIPVSKPPEPPVFREGYTRETLMAAIRDGIDANGKPLDPFMPRYDIDDVTLDGLMVYLDTLSQTASPGVTEDTIHFATIILSSNSMEKNKALRDVMEQYVLQKNIETRYESKRAKNAPWHKEWLFKPYRKWQIHTWELRGEKESWPVQLADYYQKQPVFALINGIVPSGWELVHEFCERETIPCLFPTTSLPVIDETDFYTIYLTKGAVHEAEAVASYITKTLSVKSVTQFIDKSSQLSVVSADSLRNKLKKNGLVVDDVVVGDPSDSSQLLPGLDSEHAVVLWLDQEKSDQLINGASQQKNRPPIILSTLHYGHDSSRIPNDLVNSLVFVHTSEMPEKTNKLLMRSTGWFRAKRIYDPNEKVIQANAYFALKVVGDAVKHIRGYFYRDYFIEKIEHMIDDLPYTSIYPRVSMAPDQRFVSRGYYIAKLDGKGGIRNITEWVAP
ncbi:MAG: ABC transporter substrate-binding protein [Candidatus Thiodiazotropha endolucinida]